MLYSGLSCRISQLCYSFKQVELKQQGQVPLCAQSDSHIVRGEAGVIQSPAPILTCSSLIHTSGLVSITCGCLDLWF